MTDLSTAAPQSMYPHQPGYVPSPPPDDMRLEPGARSHEPKFDGTHYEQAEALFAHVQKELKKHIEKTAANAHLYSQEGLRKQLAAFQHTDAAKGIDKALARVEAVHEQAKADMERVYRELTPPGDAVAESRAARYWHRSERLLDASKDKQGIARQLIEKSSNEELAVLLEGLPVYLASVGAQGSWLDEEVAKRSPAYGMAKRREHRASQAVVQVKSSALLLQSALREGRAMHVPIRFNRSIDPDK